MNINKKSRNQLMKKWCILWIFLIAVHLSEVTATQVNTLNFRPSNYHSSTQNWDVTQTPDGRVFFANNYGMLRFDGSQWDLFVVANYTPVRALLLDTKAKRIYAGASDEFGFFSVKNRGKDLVYTSLTNLIPASKRHFGEIWHIMQQGNRVVFQSKERMYVMTDEKQINVFENGRRIECSALVGQRIITAGKGGAYELTAHGLTHLKGTEVLDGKVVRSILPYKKNILFATDIDGIFIYDGETVTPFVMDITPYIKEKHIFSATTRGDLLVIGTVKGGIVLKDLVDNEKVFVNTACGLQNNTVLTLAFDQFNNLWAGLDNGISYINKDLPYQPLLNPLNNIGTGYDSRLFGSKLYLGTNQGLFTIDYPIASKPQAEDPQPVSGCDGQVWCLVSMADGLLCGSDKGLFSVKGTTSKRVDGVEGTWNVKPLTSRPGYALGCDYGGFFILQQQADGQYVMRNRLSNFHEISGSIEEDSDGSIWVTHWLKGVFHFRLSADMQRAEQTEHYGKGCGLPTDGDNLLCKVNGRIYISSHDGIYHFDKKTRKLVHDEAMSKVFDTYGASLRITETPWGDLWGIKGDYIAYARRQKDGTYLKDTLTFEGIEPYLIAENPNIGFIGKNLTIVNTNDGYYVLNTSKTEKSRSNHLIIKAVSSIESDTILYTYTPLEEIAHEVKITHALNSFSISYVMPEYRDPQAVEYQCYLEGYEKGWTKMRNATKREFSHVRAGKYVFHVRSTNRITGITEEVTLNIRVLPAWYESGLACTAYVLLVILMIYLLVKYLIKRAQHEMTKLEREKERQLKEQQTRYERDTAKKEQQLAMLKNQQLEAELKHKSSELATSTMNLIHKNEIMQMISENLDTLSESVRREGNKTKVIQQIKDIKYHVDAYMQENSNWEKFEQNFDIVYDDFMKKLYAKYPTLKIQEKWICACLRMGLNSKEIASLLNTSVRSIENARYRLRKKLGMEKGENLSDFIQRCDAAPAEQEPTEEEA